MFWVCATLSAAGVLESVICSCLLAELAGYRVNRMLGRDQLSSPIGCQIGRQFLRYGPQPLAVSVRPPRAHRTGKAACNDGYSD
jgi:hypothetical protein